MGLDLSNIVRLSPEEGQLNIVIPKKGDCAEDSVLSKSHACVLIYVQITLYSVLL